MSAGEQYGIDLWILGHQLCDVLTDEVVCSIPLALTILYERYPHGAGLLTYPYLGEELAYLRCIGARGDCTWGGYYSHMTCLGEARYSLHRRTYDPEDTPCRV